MVITCSFLVVYSRFFPVRLHVSNVSIPSCVFLKVKVDINSHNKKNDKVVTQARLWLQRPHSFFKLGRPTGTELRNKYRGMGITELLWKGENPPKRKWHSLQRHGGLADQEHNSHNLSTSTSDDDSCSCSPMIHCKLGIAPNTQKQRTHPTHARVMQISYTLWCTAEISAYVFLYWTLVVYVCRKRTISKTVGGGKNPIRFPINLGIKLSSVVTCQDTVILILPCFDSRSLLVLIRKKLKYILSKCIKQLFNIVGTTRIKARVLKKFSLLGRHKNNYHIKHNVLCFIKDVNSHKDFENF